MIPTPPQLLGSSPILVKALEVPDRMTRESLSVLLGGDDGSGEELFTRPIHAPVEDRSFR